MNIIAKSATHTFWPGPSIVANAIGVLAASITIVAISTRASVTKIMTISSNS